MPIFPVHINNTEWLELDDDTRKKLREVFLITRSGPVIVVNGDNLTSKLVSDGTTEKDLEILNIGSMILFLAEDLPWYAEDFRKNLLTMTVNKIYGRPLNIGLPPNCPLLYATLKRPLGRPKKDQEGSSETAGEETGGETAAPSVDPLGEVSPGSPPQDLPQIA